MLDLGVKNQLFTYIYLRDKVNSREGRTMLSRLRTAKSRGYYFMLDSGAFTYQQKANLPGNGGLPPPRAYFEEYARFVIDHGDIFDVITELDIDGFVRDVTTATVNGWTDELLRMAEGGPKVMPVYHTHRGKRWLQDWLSDPASPHIGYGSELGGGAPVQSLISLAHRFGKFVHGFGQTRMKTDIKYTYFDSVDSSTWLRADRFGGTMIYRNGKLIVLDHLHKKDRALHKNYFESHGLDFKKVMQDDLHTMRMATIICWREMALDYERKGILRTGGRGPHLYQYWKDHGHMPKEGWLVDEHGQPLPKEQP